MSESRYRIMCQHLHNIYGEDIQPEQIIEEFISAISDPGKPLTHVKILTNEEAKKWERWKLLEQQCRLVELPCALGDMVYYVKGYDPNNNKCSTIIQSSPIKAIGIEEDGIYIKTDDSKYNGDDNWKCLTLKDTRELLNKIYCEKKGE